MINNFGATTSLQNILDELEKAGTKIKRETLNTYVKILCDAKILYECNRFDLKSKKSISGEKKYYLSDLGFYYATNTDNRINYGPVMENVAFAYARSKDYSVSIGRIGKLECDFILQIVLINSLPAVFPTFLTFYFVSLIIFVEPSAKCTSTA